jgi:hypothetical protein
LIRAQNGVGINTNNPQSALHVNGIVTASGFAGDGSSLLGLSASQLTSGTLPGGDLAGTYGNAVTFNNPANSFTGNGAGLTGVNAATLGGLASSSFWKTSGNAGTTPGANFIGTTDGQALLIKGSFVGVGRSTRITLSEYFGVEAPAGSGAFGGMYVNASAGGLPFYGYSQGGGGGVYHYVDGTDGNKWKLFVSTSVAITATPTGLVGIGTTVPDATLTVAGSADKPGGGAWGVFSDARLKKNIRPLAGALDRLLQLQGVTFEYKDPQAIHELAGVQIGMIAQEVEKVFPDWVETAPNGMKRLSIHGFESLTVEALRELRAEKGAKIAELEKANAEMRSQLAAQKESLARLEARFAALETADGQRAGKSAATLAASEDR